MRPIEPNTLIAQHVVWNERLGRWMTRSKADAQAQYDLTMMMADRCEFCGDRAMIDGVCRSCGIDLSRDEDAVTWD